MGLFGMTQYIGQVGGDIFVNFAVSGATQIPGNFVAWWVMNKLGRKITLMTSHITAGVAALLLIAVPQSKYFFFLNKKKYIYIEIIIS